MASAGHVDRIAVEESLTPAFVTALLAIHEAVALVQVHQPVPGTARCAGVTCEEVLRPHVPRW